MGTGAEFVGPLLAEELAAGFATEMAAGGIFATAAAGVGEFVGPLTAAESAAGGGFEAYMADLGFAGADLAPTFAVEVGSQAAGSGMSPESYTDILTNMGDEAVYNSTGNLGEVIPQSTGEGLMTDPSSPNYGMEQGFSSDPSAANYGMDQVPQNTLEQQGSLTEGITPGNVASTEAAYPQQNALKDLWNGAKDVLKTPQYQLAKTGIDLYSQFQDGQAAKAGLNRFNQLADRSAWANQAGQDLYTNPNAFFNSPAFKASQAGAMNEYRRKQAASGRRADTAGLALQMQQYGLNQLNNQGAGIARFNQQPNTSGLQQMYQGAGRAQSNMYNTFANKDLWDAIG